MTIYDLDIRQENFANLEMDRPTKDGRHTLSPFRSIKTYCYYQWAIVRGSNK